MAYDDGIPSAVKDAAAGNLGSGVTGYLLEPELLGFSLAGQIFFDQKDRFKNGRVVCTSAVQELYVQGDYLMAVTLTDSVYVLVNADQSIFNLRIRGNDESFALDH